MLAHGADGMRQASEDAVLNANYIRAGLADLMSQPFGNRPQPETGDLCRAELEEKQPDRNQARSNGDFAHHDHCQVCRIGDRLALLQHVRRHERHGDIERPVDGEVDRRQRSGRRQDGDDRIEASHNQTTGHTEKEAGGGEPHDPERDGRPGDDATHRRGVQPFRDLHVGAEGNG